MQYAHTCCYREPNRKNAVLHASKYSSKRARQDYFSAPSFTWAPHSHRCQQQYTKPFTAVCTVVCCFEGGLDVNTQFHVSNQVPRQEICHETVENRARTRLRGVDTFDSSSLVNSSPKKSSTPSSTPTGSTAMSSVKITCRHKPRKFGFLVFCQRWSSQHRVVRETNRGYLPAAFPSHA